MDPGHVGTMLSADPTDISGAVSIISSKTWDDLKRLLHLLRLGLSAVKRTRAKHYRNPTYDTKREVDDALRVFRQHVSNILMRRHDDFKWNGKRPLDLPSLHFSILSCRFSDEFRPAYDNMMQVWSNANLSLLREKQATWDLKQHDSRSVIRRSMEQP